MGLPGRVCAVHKAYASVRPRRRSGNRYQTEMLEIASWFSMLNAICWPGIT